MFDLSDTVVAVSSPAGGLRSILRITGPQALSVCAQVFEPSPGSDLQNQKSDIKHRTILSGSVRIDAGLAVDAHLYLFFAPRSYTGDDLAEIHVPASRVLVEALVQNLLARGLRPAEPGEFTARAYLNGKLDLAQAEAVNEIISGSNRLQLEAAQKLLGGRLTQAADAIRAALLDCLSLIEAGLDFSGEDLEFITAREVSQRLTAVRRNLEELLAGSIRYETLIDLPAVGLAGAPNAGKSSLLNALLGWERSIVSPQPKTTRDVLTGVLTTPRFQCVLFDCAGLIPAPGNVLDELAQRAAIEALQGCALVLFCVDLTKPDTAEDRAVRSLIQPQEVLCLATKADVLSAPERSRKIAELGSAFGVPFLATSSRTALGLPDVLESIERMVVCDRAAGVARSESAIRNHVTARAARQPKSEISLLALTARHRQAVTDALEQVVQATAEVTQGREEVAVLLIRAACQSLTQIEQQPLDEQVLDRIFRRFCIGK
ncbi:MAG: 50S ribosome-binding GTPase [Planctomycetes bacterium]|nr:50S ribosome-binding GTPase [Planctomycetota bacterium]